MRKKLINLKNVLRGERNARCDDRILSSKKKSYKFTTE